MERKKETETNNILLANFLEWKESTWTEPTDGFKVGRKYDFELPDGLNLYKEEEIWFESQWGYADVEQERCFKEDLRFHTDWNWLMLVVDKIESLNNDGFDVSILADGTIITRYRETPTSNLSQGVEIVRLTSAEIGFNHKIEHTYQACVEFIKWYNEFYLK